MNIKEFGGEFALINSIEKKPTSKNVIKSIGDDCAVIQKDNKNDEFYIITKDILVEGDHFSLNYFTPYDVGIKAIESNVSDIASMGGFPMYALVGISLTEKISIEWVHEFYRGLNERCDEYGVDIIGGDTTHGRIVVVSITIIGEAKKKQLTFRAGAKVGDIIKVTDYVGASTAGFKLFRKGIEGYNYVKKKHCQPRSDIKLAKKLGEVVTAMTDISDGVCADLKNILRSSNVSGMIEETKIPIHPETIQAANALGEEAMDYAMYGGEDFKLLYTVNPAKSNLLDGYVIGEIIENTNSTSKLFFKKQNNKIIPLTKNGFDHFA